MLVGGAFRERDVVAGRIMMLFCGGRVFVAVVTKGSKEVWAGAPGYRDERRELGMV